MKFSPLIIGCMRLGEWGAKLSTDELEHFIDACIDRDLVDFDHADIYGHYSSEREFGEVIARRPDLKSKVQITTKCGIKMVSDRRPDHKIKSYDSTPEHIFWSVDQSLQYLNVDKIDLLLLHRPDFLMDVKAIADCFNDLKKEGKVLNFGVSNFTPTQVKMLHAQIPLINHQIEVSPFHLDAYQDGSLDICQSLNIIPTAWSPYGGGEIFSDHEKYKDLRQKLTEIAERHSASMDQIILAWICKHPIGIIPLLGTSKVERIDSAIKSLDINLTHEEWYDIWQASTGKRIP